MNCKVCGAQLTGTETVCPVCGTPITNNIENAPAVPIPEAPIAPAAPEVPAEPVVASSVTPIPEAPVAPVEPVVEAPVEVAPVTPVEPVTPVAPVESVESDVTVVEPPVEVQPAIETPAVEPVAPVAPVEPVAPVAPVEPVAPVVPAAPIPETPVVPVEPVMEAPVAPTPIVDNQQAINPFQQTPVMTAPQDVKQPKQKRPVNTKFIIFMIVGVLLIGFCLYWTYVVQAEPETPKPTTPTTPDVVEETFTYKGQEMSLSSDYTTTTNDNYGAIIKYNDNTYTVELDYYNNLEAYKKKLEEVYPDKKDTLVKTVGDREYLIVEVKDTTEAIADMYVTKINGDYIATGFITNKDFKALTDDEIKGLNTVFSNMSEVTDFDKTTATFGKDEVKLLTFDKTKLS